MTDNLNLIYIDKLYQKHGALSYNQCFGFVLLPGIRGFKDVDHMDKVKSQGCYLMYQLGGVLDD